MGKPEQLLTDTEQRPSLTGTVEDVVFHNPANDYTVIELSTDDGDSVMAVGCMPTVHKGESVVLYGDFTYHATYGQQFSVENFEKILPVETEDILKYLSSGVLKGIGPVTALKIVNRFGAETFDVIQNHPTWLADIPGITRKKAAAITQAFNEQNGLRRLMMSCREFLGPISIAKIYREWGDNAISIIEDNPFRLCDEFDGIGFEKADRIAQKLGIVSDSEYRISSGLRYVLQTNANNAGHTCLPKDKLIEATAEQLSLSVDKIAKVLDDQLDRKHMVAYHPQKENYIFALHNARAEQYVSEKLWLLSRTCAAVSDSDIGSLIAMTEAERGIHYAALQMKAIREALTSGVMVLTGGPGTGKTTVVQALLRIFKQMNCKTALAAPTGRAAKRMSEATGEEARTIHRMLEMEKTEDGTYLFKRNENNPLDEKVVIIDEASMIDLPLMEGMLRAITRGTRLILIGDDNQLPPVGCGNVLKDVIASERFTTVSLTEIFRQSEKSMIVVNAHRINQGELPLLHIKNEDSFFLARATDGQITDTIVQLLTVRLPKAYGNEILDKLQIITPSRKGLAGTENLNKLLKEYLNPKSDDKKEIRFRDNVFREGDKVMQIRNNYEIEWTRGGTKHGTGVFNGDIGVITKIDVQDETVEITYEDKVASYDFPVLEEVEHAYAITVHKSQGSEYPVVIIPLYNCPPMLRTRNLFYTALTRARQMVIMVGSEDVARNMVDNNYQTMRYTALEMRLREIM